MRLSPDEERFLRHWMYDEVHYQDRQGMAKRLQLQYRVAPADLAALIAAAIPSPSDQEAAGYGPPPGEPVQWPWTSEEFHSRIAEARAVLSETRQQISSKIASNAE